MINIEEKKYKNMEAWYLNCMLPIVMKNLDSKPDKLLALKRKLDYFNMSSSQIYSEDFWKTVLINPFSDTSRKSFLLLDEYYMLLQLLQRDKTYINLKYEYQNAKKNTPRNSFYKSEREKVIKDFYQQHVTRFVKKSGVDYARTFTNYESLFTEVEKNLKGLNKLMEELVHYGLLPSKNRVQLIKNIDCNVCPYCNRQFITIAKKRKKGEFAMAHLDHFIPKAVFPLYSLSLYNFIPSCATCNSQLKLRSNLPIISPISSEGNDSPIFEFEYENISALLGRNDNLSIKVKKEEFNRYLLEKQFELESQYVFHLKDVQLYHQRALLYYSSYNDMYKKLFSFKSSSPIDETEIKEIIFGYASSKSEISQKPLSKLYHDLSVSTPIMKKKKN